MNTICKLLSGVALLPASLFAQEAADSVACSQEKVLELNEVVVAGRRTVVKQQKGSLVYIVKNDPYAKGLDGISLLGRIPRVSVADGSVSVAGKGTVRYIIDGVLMELDDSALAMRIRNLRAENIEKIELLSAPPSRYAVEPNAAYISITTRNETLGTRGNIYGSLNQGNRLREYLSGSVNHTTRRVEMALDASLSNYCSTNDNNLEYAFADHTQMSSSRTDSHLFNAGVNALFRYMVSSDMKLGVIANYNYETTSSDGVNESTFTTHTSSSVSRSCAIPNNALTATVFCDWRFGSNGEAMELTYNYFNRHSPTSSNISTTYSNGRESTALEESGASDYRFHSGKADFKLPYPWAQLEAGIAYTDILNSSDNLIQYIGSAGTTDRRDADMFDYRERIAAAYVTASRSLGKGFWGKVGLRYEYTWSRGEQLYSGRVDRDNYGRLFPSVNISWSKDRVGSFHMNYSAGMGRPNLWELNPYKYYSTADEYASGNPALKPTVYHNAEINYYGLGGLYAVLYTSSASDAVGYIRRFDSDRTVCTMPYNCLATNKTGIYASYSRDIFRWCEMKLGGEVFHTSSRGDVQDYKIDAMDDWSGKLEVSAGFMLNRQKTLILNARFTHFFPWQQNMVCYDSFSLFNVSLRYSLLNNRLDLHLTANDIFGWNRTRSTEHYADFTLRQTFNGHTSYVLFGLSYRFGRDKVNSVNRASKEIQSRRTK